MKRSKVNSKFKRSIVISKDAEVMGDIMLAVDTVEVGDFIKLMIAPDNDKVIKYFGANFAVFYHLLRYVTWETGYVSTAMAIKEQIAQKCDIKTDMVEVHIRQYILLGLMKRVGVGLCQINPLRVFVGDKTLQKQVALDYHKK